MERATVAAAAGPKRRRLVLCALCMAGYGAGGTLVWYPLVRDFICLTCAGSEKRRLFHLLTDVVPNYILWKARLFQAVPPTYMEYRAGANETDAEERQSSERKNVKFPSAGVLSSLLKDVQQREEILGTSFGIPALV